MHRPLKIMTFNARVSVYIDEENQFCYRTPRIKKMIEEISPDIICFQEISPTSSRDWCVENLTDYYIVGCGRDADYEGEELLIAYKKRDLILVSYETKALSLTPHKFGTIIEGIGQSEYPRIYVKALFKHKEIDEPFYVYNIHTDYIANDCRARVVEITQVLSDICSHDVNFVLAGDFNAYPDSDEIKMITACKDRNIVWATKGTGATFHDFGRIDLQSERGPIDYIFTDGKNRVFEKVNVDDIPENGVYISDHHPLYVVMEINGNNKCE